ncbi:MAG: type I-C CRISPR-associated protein Cas8c/Csd1 [Magnetococcales bacterium]|nr:type I-C CRISPR-associated protein Cas8c/Csd1 [Magnetococcales bacterium]
MILQSLYALYDRLASDPDYGIAAPGYSTQNVSFAVVLTPTGELLHFEDEQVDQIISATGGKKKTVRKPKSLRLPGQSKPPGQGINPCFLWDNAKYMLGFDPKDAKPERTLQTFQAFRKHHLDLEAQINDPAFSAVCRFLESWSPEQSVNYPILTEQGSGFGVFRIAGEEGYLHERPCIGQWWQSRINPAATTAPKEHGLCLISGTRDHPIARIHEPKIKGVRDAQSTGALMVSFNGDVFESYGKEQSYNAPVSEMATFRYCTALNTILNGAKREKHRIRLDNDTVIFWTERKTVAEESIAILFNNRPDTSTDSSQESQDPAALEHLQVFMKALREGMHYLEDDPSVPFYILGLSPNAGRISVRFWHVSTLGHFVERLRDHFEAINIVRPSKGREFPPVWMLLKESARDGKDVAPLLEGSLMRAILNGTPYPDALAAAVIRRIRADRDDKQHPNRQINYLRAAILKAWLNRSPRWKGEITVSLDTTRPDPAYRLGRLFAALEKTQEEALPGINATIRDRFYGAASATPGSVFPRLLRTYQHHLGKISFGAKVNREKNVQEIMSAVTDIPSTLSLEEQGLFAIGYYHQRQAFFTAKGDTNPISIDNPA